MVRVAVITRTITLLAALLFGALAFAACSDSNDDSSSDAATATVAVEPTAAATTTPPPSETGIQAIDDAIAAVEADDTDALIATMLFAQIECSATPVPLYQVPPCDGEPEGSLIDAFPMASCEGAYVPRADATDGVRQSVDERTPATLYGVFETTGTQVDDGFADRAGPKYAAVFTYDFTGDTYAWALLLNDEGLVGALLGCAEDPAGFVANWRFSETVP